LSKRSVIVGIAAAVLAVALFYFFRPAPSYELRFTQLTFDPGLTTSPAISPDGKLIAYVSDRDTGKNLELYVQPAFGGGGKRLTTGKENHFEPAFSPDGATIAFAADGGIFTMSAAGGDPRLLVPGGHTPHYSPDGRWIAFADASGTAVVDSAGGAPRRFHPEIHAVRAPVWSPDGRSLIFWADGDLHVAPIEGGEARSIDIQPRLTKSGIQGVIWDAVWSTYGLIFSARTGFARNLYRCPLGRDGKVSGDIERLTNGTELIGDPSVSREGRVVFSSGRERFDIWALPLEGESGKVTGVPYRITDTLAPTANPDLSADGQRLIFGSSRDGFTEVWEKDLKTGRERLVASSPEGAAYGRLLKSSAEILSVRPTAGHPDIYLGDRKLAAGDRAWDANRAASTVLVSGGAGIDAIDVATKQRTTLVPAPPQTILSDASFSPDQRWIVFSALSGGISRIYVAPARGGNMQAISGESVQASKPRFSLSGKMIYFLLDTDGSREIDRVGFDTDKGISSVKPSTVFRPFDPRLSLASVNAQALDISVAKDKLTTIFCEQTTTIWLGDLVLH
jgi:Tol biopolymer transport system component